MSIPTALPVYCYTHRISYAETDKMGVVYYAVYLYIFERARTEYIRSRLDTSYNQLEEEGYILPVTHVECFYKKSILYDALIHVYTWITDWKRVSLCFHYVIQDPEGTLYAHGSTTLASLSITTKKPIPLPKWFKRKYENEVNAASYANNVL